MQLQVIKKKKKLVLKISAPEPRKKLLKIFNSLRIVPFGIKLEQIDRQFYICC